MSVIVDTSVWSLALRRRTPPDSSPVVTRLRDLITNDQVNVDIAHLHCHLFSGLRITLILNEKIFKRIVLFPTIGIKVTFIH